MAAMWRVLKKSYIQWSQSNVFEHAAALAYATLFSIAPTLILAIAISGIIFGNKAAEGKIFLQIRDLIGQESASMIQRIIHRASVGGNDILATTLGGIFFLLGATAVFAQLKSSLNTMWKIKPKEGLNNFLKFFKIRLLSLAMVIAFCFVLLVSLVLSTVLSTFGALIADYLPMTMAVLKWVNLLLSTAGIGTAFALIYKFLPDIRPPWKEVAKGALVATLLFACGKSLISLYIQHSGISTLYGTAASLVIIMVWIFYSSLILFFGASVTHVCCQENKGKKIKD